MARHQAFMTQYNKLVCVAECPAEVNDNVPLKQLVNQLEKIDPLNNLIVPQHRTSKTVLPLLWKIDSDVPDHLMGDTMRLTQILLNLCSNAVKVKTPNPKFYSCFFKKKFPFPSGLVYKIRWHPSKNYKVRPTMPTKIHQQYKIPKLQRPF